MPKQLPLLVGLATLLAAGAAAADPPKVLTPRAGAKLAALPTLTAPTGRGVVLAPAVRAAVVALLPPTEKTTSTTLRQAFTVSPSALRAAPQGALTPFTWLMGTSAVVSFGAWFPDAANPAAPQATLAVQHIPAGAWFVDCELIDPPGATAFTVQVGDPSGAVTESIPAPAGHLVFGAVFKAADGSVRVYRAAGWSWKSCTFEPND